MRKATGLPRTVPLWFFFLFSLLWAIVTILLAWSVKTSLSGSQGTGVTGEMALEVAAFPEKVKTVYQDLSGYVTGRYEDESLRVERDPGADYSGFRPLPTGSGPAVEGLLIEADPARMARGWRLLSGAFRIDGEIENAALLLSPDLEIVRQWVLDEVPVGGSEPRPTHRKFVHGLEILDDGSLIFTFDGSISLQRFDACGTRLWATPGDFHHAVTLDDSGEAVWTFFGDRIVEVAVEDGRIRRDISMEAIIAANPKTDILGIRRAHATDLGRNSRDTEGTWMWDRFHLNDVDPLPAALAWRFDGFSAGDLVVSARSLNLIFVLDPDTLQVKWWRMGAVQRQHDPDWLPNGEILVLNNRMGEDFSEIVSIDPVTFERTTLFDGRENNFYTRIRGKQQRLNSGALIVTSAQQGRAFEIDPTGEIALEIVNTKPGGEPLNYVISDLRWLPPDAIDPRSWTCLPSNS
ncbi:MAG: arylsulfotransferase family protein [Rhodospirillales bacterium]